MKYLDRFFEPDHWQQDTFTNAAGKKIRYGFAEPVGEKKGTVILTTGYADFIDSYHETIHDYLDRGYAVYAMDWAGQGGSDKNYSDDQKAQVITDHIRDLHQFRHTIAKVDAQKPVILSTHSLGGQVSMHYLKEHEKDFDYAVLAAPLVDFSIKGMARGILKAVFQSAVGLGLGDLIIRDGRKGITKQLTEERKRLKRQDPVRMDLHKTFFLMNRQLRAEDPTIGLINSLFEYTAKLNEEVVLSSIKTPVLFGLAGEDNIVDNDAIRKAANFMPNAKLVEIKGATHSLWHERQSYRQEWWRAVDGFLDEQLKKFVPKDPSNDNGGKDNKIAAAPKNKPEGPRIA